MHSRKDHLPEWKLTQFDGNPLNWHEWFRQFNSTVDSAILSDDEKLTYLKTLVVGKAKSAIVEYSYSGVLYKDALATLQRQFGQPHAVVGAHLDKLSNFPPLKMHNSENVIGFSSASSGLVAVFKSLSFNDDLKSVNLLNQAPPNLKEAWSMQTVRRQWHRPTLLDFNEWLKEKAEGHERLKTINSKSKSEESVKQKIGTKVFASNANVSKKTKEKPKYPPCSVCKGQHALWNCAVFKEKNATQRANYVAEQKFCFSCLQSNHSFRNCSKARNCPKPDCESTHNVLLHGAEKIFPPKDTKSSPASGNANAKHVSTNAAVGNIHSQESTKGLLPVASLAVSADATITNALALCDSASTHSWISADLVKRLHLVGAPVNLTINRFNSTSLMKTQQVSFQVSAETNNSEFSFSFRAYVKDHIRIGSDSISIPELQEKYPHLAPIKPRHHKYEDVEIIIGQDFYHAIRPVEYLLGEDSISLCAVRLPIGWVLSGPLPPSFKSNSSCFKCIVEDMSVADQIKTWYELESFGAFKQVDARSAADKRALSVLKNDIFHDGERYIVPMLWNDKESTLPNNYFSSLAHLKSLEKRLDKDPSLRKKYAETIREDMS